MNLKRTASGIISLTLLIQLCLAQSTRSLDGKSGEQIKGGTPLKSRRRLHGRRLLQDDYSENTCSDYASSDGCPSDAYCDSGTCVIYSDDYGCDDYADGNGCEPYYTYCSSGTCVSRPSPTPAAIPSSATNFVPYVPYGVSPPPRVYSSTPSSYVYSSPSKSPNYIGAYVGAAIGGTILLSGIIVGAIFMHKRRIMNQAKALQTPAAEETLYGPPEHPPEPSNDISRDIVEVKAWEQPVEEQITPYNEAELGSNDENSDIERGVPASYNVDGTDASAYSGDPGVQEQGEVEENECTPSFDPHSAPTAPSGQPPPPDTPSLPATAPAMAPPMTPTIAQYDQLHFPSSPTDSETASIDFGQWSINFNDLQMVKPIGSGSFGRVYLAMWHESPVAVKVLLDIGV